MAETNMGTLHDWKGKGRAKHTFKSGTLRGKTRLKLMTIAKKTLGSGDIAGAVVLPPGEDLYEWFAMHVVDFYNEISLLYGIVAEIDTAERFPVMGAGTKYEYHWADETTARPLKLSAPAYVDRLFTWIEEQLNDEAIFPTTLDSQFPANFKSRVGRIFRRLFRVYAHIYYSHFEYIVQQSAQAHVNSCFKHFVLFVREFKLVDEKEMEPLKDVIAGLLSDNRAESTETAPPVVSTEKTPLDNSQSKKHGASQDHYHAAPDGENVDDAREDVVKTGCKCIIL